MKNIFQFVIVVVFWSGHPVQAQTIRSLPIDNMLKEINQTNDIVTVLNFWSTWFEESTKQLPVFDELSSMYADKNVKVILCNLDFNYNIDTIVKPFLLQHPVKSAVWHVTESDSDKWKNKIDVRWNGDIPATIIYFRGKVVYVNNGTDDIEKLKQEINQLLK